MEKLDEDIESWSGQQAYTEIYIFADTDVFFLDGSLNSLSTLIYGKLIKERLRSRVSFRENNQPIS